MKTRRGAVIYAIGMMFALALGLVSTGSLWAEAVQSAVPPPPSIATLESTYGKLPLSFEANQGQTDPCVQFLTRGRGHQLYLTPSEAVLALRADQAKADGRADHAV